MASKYRSVDIRFWSDAFVRKLTFIEKGVFLYFLTSPHSSWCGVYEIPLDVAAFEMCIDEKDLRIILSKIYPKIIYIESWIFIPNWVKHHMSESGNMSPQQKKGLDEAFSKVPENIRLKIREYVKNGIPYPYPMGGVSAFTLTLTSTLTPITPASQEVQNLNKLTKNRDMKYQDTHHSDFYEETIDYDSRKLTTKKDKLSKEVFVFSEEMEVLKLSRRPADKFIAHYWALKKYEFKTALSFKKQYGRDVIYAQELVGYPLEDVFKAFKKAEADGEEKHFDWKISTVVKIIPGIKNVN